LLDHHYYEFFNKDKMGVISRLDEGSRETSKESFNQSSPKKTSKRLIFRSEAISNDSGEKKPK
jgi:hypothetical protein